MKHLLEEFYAHQKKIQIASTIWNVAANDQNNHLPPAAQATRADQLSFINGHIHELSHDPRYKEIVRELSQNKEVLSKKDVRSLFLTGLEMDVEYHSKKFLEEFDKVKNNALVKWHEAKKQGDRSILVPALEKSFEMAKEYARLYNPEMNPLSVRCDYREFGMSAEKYQSLFAPVIATCNEIVAKVKQNEKSKKLYITEYDHDTLMNLLHELMETIGFDFEQGILAAIKWPYSENCGPGDERIHVAKGKPLLETILAGLHECGHGLTDMHINPDYHRTNLHRSLSMGIHESQARGLENMIGRSKPFCIYLTTLLNKYFPKLAKRNADELYSYLNHVETGANRITSDEISYNTHIIIRFEIEQEVFSGNLAVKDIPARRNELYKKYLSVTVKNDVEGCLQDQHRPLGLFGYFPTYALGNIIAAQFRASFTQAHPKWDKEIAKGNFSSYFNWFKQNIRRRGNIDTTSETIIRVTKRELQADDFVNYLTHKYLGV